MRKKSAALDFRRKSIQVHKIEYRKNWNMIHEDKRRSAKKEQRDKFQLKIRCLEENDKKVFIKPSESVLPSDGFLSIYNMC